MQVCSSCAPTRAGLFNVHPLSLPCALCRSVQCPIPYLSPCTGLFIIDTESVLRQIIVNDIGVGRSVDEVMRLVQAYQFVDIHGEGELLKYSYKTLGKCTD